MDLLKEYMNSHNVLSGDTYAPIFFRLVNTEDRKNLEQLLEDKNLTVIDEIDGQLRELVKSLNPSRKIAEREYPDLVSAHVGKGDLDDYGVWVYYPWTKKLIHLLDETEFVEVRTNRNRYKITREEQNSLSNKKIGVIGLSVGQSIALTLAMERTCGEIRLADFDTAELSNLNRIRTGVQNLGVKKTVIAAREIAEIDPFLKVKIYSDGVTNDNIDDFFTAGGKLDALIEVCDGLNVKILTRFKARDLRIPVIMDTNDRGMLDVERFDLEPDRPILHGLAGDLDPAKIGDLTNEEKVPYILKMIGAETISTRLKASMMEVEQSINTWPQLASSVTLGGGLTTDVCRRVLLGQFHDSGRYYIDLDTLIADRQPETAAPFHMLSNPYTPLQKAEMDQMVDGFLRSTQRAIFTPTDKQINDIIAAAMAAPSAGNNQPWMWYYSSGILFLFHNKHKSWSWGDYFEMGSHMGLGASLENVKLTAATLGLAAEVTLLPVKEEPKLIAAIRFTPGVAANEMEGSLASNIFTRYTNRKLGERKPLPEAFFQQFQQVATSADTNISTFYVDNEALLAELGDIIAECDKVRLLHQQGHEEFYSEVKWTREEALKTHDGIELAAVDVTQSEAAGFRVAQDWKAVSLLAEWNKGDAFKRLSVKSVKAASAIVVFAIPEFNHTELINAGSAVERAWLFANSQGVSVYPMLSSVFFFNRLIHGHGADMPEHTITELQRLRERFLKIFPLRDKHNKGLTDVFLMKLAIADDIGIRSLRKPIDELFYRR